MRYHKKEQGGGIIEGQKTAVSIFLKKNSTICIESSRNITRGTFILLNNKM